MRVAQSVLIIFLCLCLLGLSSLLLEGGDLLMRAGLATGRQVIRLTKYGKGLLC